MHLVLESEEKRLFYTVSVLELISLIFLFCSLHNCVVCHYKMKTVLAWLCWIFSRLNCCMYLKPHWKSRWKSKSGQGNLFMSWVIHQKQMKDPRESVWCQPKISNTWGFLIKIQFWLNVFVVNNCCWNDTREEIPYFITMLRVFLFSQYKCTNFLWLL